MFLDKLERKFGKYSIKNLMAYIVVANILTFLFMNIVQNGQQLIDNMRLYPAKVLNGEVWRLFTFIFVPQESNVIFFLLSMYVYYWIGGTIERLWGSFKFNIYYFTGIIATIIGNFIINAFGPSIFEVPIGYLLPADISYLNLSLFLVLAQTLPDMDVFLYFLLPIKMRYLSILYWVIIALDIFSNFSWWYCIYVLAPLTAFFLFFGKDWVLGFRSKKRKRDFNKKMHPNLKVVDGAKYHEVTHPVHKCTVCGITEKDDPDMEFRFCRQCKGFHEYCMKHLHEHEHIEE